jgi:membrane associated rhomboid family serine protease
MIPLRDENPTGRIPVITLAFIALNIAAFVAWMPTFGSQTRQIAFLYCNALVPWEVSHQESLAEGGGEAREAIDEQRPLGPRVSGADLQDFLDERCPGKEWWHAVFVSMFLHGGWLHIGGNMLFLWIFGNNVEDQLGRVLYFLFYVAAGVAATAAQILVAGGGSVVPNLGASGAVAGVLGAYIVMFPRRRVLTLVIFYFITAVYLPAWVVLALWFVLQLFSGAAAVTTPVETGGGIAYWAHIGGFAFGAVLAYLFFPKERVGRGRPPPRPDPFRGRW